MRTKQESADSSLLKIVGSRRISSSMLYALTRVSVGIVVSSVIGDVVTTAAPHGLVQNQWAAFTTGDLSNLEFPAVEILSTTTFRIDVNFKNTIATPGTFDIYRTVIPKTDSAGSFLTTGGGGTVVDFLDVGSYVPSAAGDGIIPRSSVNAVQVVASLASSCTSLQSVSDVGLFINIYSDAARTNLLAHLVLTPDESVDVDIPAGTALFLGAAKDVDIDDANSIIQIQFIG